MHSQITRIAFRSFLKQIKNDLYGNKVFIFSGVYNWKHVEHKSDDICYTSKQLQLVNNLVVPCYLFSHIPTFLITVTKKLRV